MLSVFFSVIFSFFILASEKRRTIKNQRLRRLFMAPLKPFLFSFFGSSAKKTSSSPRGGNGKKGEKSPQGIRLGHGTSKVTPLSSSQEQHHHHHHHHKKGNNLNDSNSTNRSSSSSFAFTLTTIETALESLASSHPSKVAPLNPNAGTTATVKGAGNAAGSHHHVKNSNNKNHSNNKSNSVTISMEPEQKVHRTAGTGRCLFFNVNGNLLQLSETETSFLQC
jgi:hypothetical protein